MLVNTAVFGPIEVDDGNIFHMPQGPLGFEDNSDYALITKQEDDVTLMWFQAVQSTMPCFVVFNPFEILDGYSPVLDAADLKALDCADAAQLVYLVVAVVPEDITKITVNLKSPIVINPHKKKARQVILANQDYPIRFPLVEAN